jgi:hypothetical protein
MTDQNQKSIGVKECETKKLTLNRVTKKVLTNFLIQNLSNNQNRSFF